MNTTIKKIFISSLTGLLLVAQAPLISAHASTGSASITAAAMTISGGGFTGDVPMSTYFLSKPNCLAYGTAHAGFEGMSAVRIAEELYAHALAYYSTTAISKVVSISIVNQLRAEASIVNLGGDSASRVATFQFIWAHL